MSAQNAFAPADERLHAEYREVGTSVSPVSLEDEAQRVLPLVRAAFISILDSIPSRPRGPRQLCKALGINQTLAWRIVQVTDGRDLFAAVRHVTGEAAVETFLGAAEVQGAPHEVLERARAAVGEFKQLVAQYAGNRQSLELMLSGMVRNGRAEADLPYRKAGFRCASHTWGVQAQTHVRTAMLYPAARDDCLHMAAVVGYHNLCRIRSQAPWILSRQYMAADDGQAHPLPPSVPIDPEGVLANGFPMLRAFCSDPLPGIRRTPAPGNAVDDQWVEGPAGDQGAATFYSGEVMHDLPVRYRAEQNHHAQFGLHVRTPMETLILDVLVHRELYGALTPEALVFSDLWGAPWETSADAACSNTLPCAERVNFIGSGLAGVQTPDVPRYEDLLAFVCAKLGWDGSRLHVYRLRFQYPVIGTAIAMRFPLPEAPAQPKP